jgi:hypothetical protein
VTRSDEGRASSRPWEARAHTPGRCSTSSEPPHPSTEDSDAELGTVTCAMQASGIRGVVLSVAAAGAP